MISVKNSIAALAVAATATVPALSTASAGERHWGGREYRVVECGPYNNFCGRRPAPRHYEPRRHDNGNVAGAIALGVIGTAIIAGALSNANPPQPVYRRVEPAYPPAPAPVYRSGPKVITYEESYSPSYEPWSREWYRWCDNRYRSFNPSKGTYRGYDGRDHFCVVK